MAASTNGITLLYLGFGIIGGFATGFAYNVLIGSVLKWFPDRQGLISGVLLMGFCMGSFLIGKAFARVVTTGISWRGAFRGLGIILFVSLLIGGVLIRRPDSEEIREISGNAAKKSRADDAQNFTTTEMLRQSSFWLYFAWATLLSAAAMALIVQASGVVMEINGSLTADSVATIAGLITIFNGIGRVLFGGLYDKVGYFKNMMLNNVMYLISVGITISGLYTHSMAVLILAFIAFGLSYGGVAPTNSAFISSFFGPKYYAMNFSIINLNLLFSSIGSTIAGIIYDRSGSYISIFFIMIGAVILGTVCTLLIRKPGKKNAEGCK